MGARSLTRVFNDPCTQRTDIDQQGHWLSELGRAEAFETFGPGA